MRSRVPVFAGMVVTAGALVGCASPNWVGYSEVNPPPRPFARRSAESVEVFLGRPPERPHVDVGMFEVKQGNKRDGTGRSMDDMLATLREHAALRGCDAVSVMNAEYVGREERQMVRGACAMYTDRQATLTKPPPGPPLPGEGALCGTAPNTSGGPMGTDDNAGACTYPLQCENRRCSMPYH